jgi:hypothetical protein
MSFPVSEYVLPYCVNPQMETDEQTSSCYERTSDDETCIGSQTTAHQERSQSPETVKSNCSILSTSRAREEAHRAEDELEMQRAERVREGSRNIW